MAELVLVEGLERINRSLSRSGRLVARAERLGLREAAGPVKADAERLSRSQISGMRRARLNPPPWSLQRIGSTIHEVYIAPKERGVKSRTDSRLRRPNFAAVMYGRAYEPALARNEQLVRSRVDAWLTRVVKEI